jgi:hypothetical protein
VGSEYETGAFDEEAAAADLLQQYEGRIGGLERLVGKQAPHAQARPAAESPPPPCRDDQQRLRSADFPNLAKDMIIDGPNRLWVADIRLVCRSKRRER